MGLLPSGQRPHSYDPGRFWSGDDLELAAGFRLGGEIEVVLPPADEAGERGSAERPARRRRFRRC